MNIEESNLTFVFPRDITVSKFDDGKFYRKSFGKMPGGKGIDIIADSGDMLQLIEIKNCKGHEQENRWRTSVDNSKVTSAPATLDVKDRDSLDIEVAKKVASTIACLYGAWTKAAQSDAARELSELWNRACDERISISAKTIMVILFLEGDFDNPRSVTRSKKMIMERLQDSIRTKLSWLNCRVSVVDSATYNKRCFELFNGAVE